MKTFLSPLGAFCVAFAAIALLVGRRAAALLGAVLLVILLPGLAAAADPSTSIDIAPILVQYVLPMIFSVLGLLGAWVLMKVRQRLGMAADDQNSQQLEQAMKNGLAFAQSQLTAKIAAGPMAVDVKSQALAIAGRYAADHVPDAMKALGVDQTLLLQKLEARLSLNTTPPEQSIAVPTPAVAPPAAP